jgi:hypothetical protein
MSGHSVVRCSVSDETVVFTVPDGSMMAAPVNIAKRSRTMAYALETAQDEESFLLFAPRGYLQRWLQDTCDPEQKQLMRTHNTEDIMLSLLVRS